MTLRSHTLAATLAAAVLGFSGCASAPAQAPRFSGRLALQVAAHDGQPANGFNASFELRGNAHVGELQLHSPLGMLVAAVAWEPGSATLRTPQGIQRHADLNELSRQAVGEALPLPALTHWLAGEPWPAAPSRPIAQPLGFEQLGWHIDLSRLAAGAVVAIRNAPPAVTVRVRLDEPT